MIRRKLVFATNNSHKLEEVSQLVKGAVDILSLKDIGCYEDIEETGSTLDENALIKARYVKEKYGYDCFGDDTGLEVDALNGEPGVYSARYAGDGHDSKANIKKLLSKMDGMGERDACFRTVVALILDGQEYLFEGKIEGNIITEERGNTGFGYDPVFQPKGYAETFAQLGLEVKNNVSHRALAIKKLCEFLNNI